jgi:hypothetical protein
MMDNETYQRLKAVHRLSRQYNAGGGVPHEKKLMELMEHHVQEIKDLTQQQDPHALTETGDLMVLCCEMLLEYNRSIDEVVKHCVGRYERKLQELNAIREEEEQVKQKPPAPETE